MPNVTTLLLQVIGELSEVGSIGLRPPVDVCPTMTHAEAFVGNSLDQI